MGAILKDGDVEIVKQLDKISPVTDEEIQDIMNAEKKAISDAYQKYKILESWVLMINTMCEAEVQRKYNAGRHSSIELHKFRVAIIRYFSMIRYMITEQRPWKKMDEEEKRKYAELKALALKEEDSTWRELVQMEDYLLEKSHALNLTNLLVSPNDPRD